MSTLSILTPRVSAESDIDSRFDALVRSSSPTLRSGQDDPGFETVFDLDYGERAGVSVSPPSAAVRVVAPRSVPATPRAVRLTRRGRVVIVLAFLAVALAVMIPLSGWATATLTGGSPEPVRIVEVHPGDTLYGIASDLAKPGHIREMVLRIQRLNSLPGGQITEGQKLAVPRG
jgi:hypothetical protein